MAKSPTSGARKEAHFDISEVSAGLSLQRHPGLRKFTISGTDGIIRAGLSWSQYDLERFFRKNQWRFCGALSHFKPRNLMAVWWWITGLVWNPRCPGMVYGPGPKLKWDRPRTVCWAAQTKLWSSLIRVAGIRAERPQDVQNHCLFMLVFFFSSHFLKMQKHSKDAFDIFTIIKLYIYCIYYIYIIYRSSCHRENEPIPFLNESFLGDAEEWRELCRTSRQRGKPPLGTDIWTDERGYIQGFTMFHHQS